MDISAIVNELQDALAEEQDAQTAENELRRQLAELKAETGKCRARVRELEDAIRTGTYQGRLGFPGPEPVPARETWPETGPADFHGRRTRPSRKREGVGT